MSKRDRRDKSTWVPRCGPSGKRMFKSYDAAIQFITGLGPEMRAEFMRAYRCQFCGRFHITSHYRAGDKTIARK